MIGKWIGDNHTPYLSRTGFLSVVDFTRGSKPIKFVHCRPLTGSKSLCDSLTTRAFIYA